MPESKYVTDSNKNRLQWHSGLWNQRIAIVIEKQKYTAIDFFWSAA